ncbi:Dirigent protein 11 [Sesamum angolense]|uniref:Dirigent protein n=1 Tax=Sesamum angolense TaxID=2727404 RepID=A0AAE1X5X4_9LAMI|nr:Dirigent protein 11 [Sesamum angolense]
MQKLQLTLVLMFGSLLMNIPRGSHAESELNLCPGRERVTRLRFYVQDLVGGENPTVWKVAQSNLTNLLPSAFGLVSVLDNLVTSGPEIESREVGRIQGLIGLADFHEKALVMLLNVVFTEGEYKGSTLSILGRNPLDDEVREVPIVGGTGGFRMARGYAVTTTYAVDKAHTHGVIEYNVVVAHYDDDAMKHSVNVGGIADDEHGGVKVKHQRLNPCLGKERLTRLRFYLQDLVGGENKTVWQVAQSNLTDVLPSAFGTVCVLDNLVTTGPEIDSQEVGRMQGLIGLADLHEAALVMLLNVVFTEGEYKGSTLSILGRNPLHDETREVPIVGGTECTWICYYYQTLPMKHTSVAFTSITLSCFIWMMMILNKIRAGFVWLNHTLFVSFLLFDDVI